MADHVSTESKTDSDEPSRGVSPVAAVQSVSPRCSPHPCGPPHDDGCLLRDRSPFLASLCSMSGGLPGIGRLSQRPAESLEATPTGVGAASPRIMSTSLCDPPPLARMLRRHPRSKRRPLAMHLLDSRCLSTGRPRLAPPEGFAPLDLDRLVRCTPRCAALRLVVAPARPDAEAPGWLMRPCLNPSSRRRAGRWARHTLQDFLRARSPHWECAWPGSISPRPPRASSHRSGRPGNPFASAEADAPCRVP
jgi:hypothetical protein